MYDFKRFTSDEIRSRIRVQEIWIMSENITNPNDGFQSDCQFAIKELKKELKTRAA